MKCKTCGREKNPDCDGYGTVYIRACGFSACDHYKNHMNDLVATQKKSKARILDWLNVGGFAVVAGKKVPIFSKTVDEKFYIVRDNGSLKVIPKIKIKRVE